MIEKKFVAEKIRELQVKEWLRRKFRNCGLSSIELLRTPVGTKVLIYSSRPGLIVGRRGANLRTLQEELKKFGLENPVVEVREVDNMHLDAQVMAEKVAMEIARFGVERFKAIGHRNLEAIMRAGAIGAEIWISGKVPSRRAKTWRFYAGYLPKCGEVAKDWVKEGFYEVVLKPGIVGVTVRILPPGLKMPDKIYIKEIEKEVKVEEVEGEGPQETQQ